MRTIALLVCLIVLAGCNQDTETTGSTSSKCVMELFPSYNARNLNQCVAACLKCDRGSTTTCSTSCTLKGAY
jgi:hypothetical protein